MLHLFHSLNFVHVTANYMPNGYVYNVRYETCLAFWQIEIEVFAHWLHSV